MIKTSKSKLIAIITGFISVIICIMYLILITVFDFRSLLNEQITNLSENKEVVSLEKGYDQQA